jgi:hypothetical protein
MGSARAIMKMRQVSLPMGSIIHSKGVSENFRSGASVGVGVSAGGRSVDVSVGTTSSIPAGGALQHTSNNPIMKVKHLVFIARPPDLSGYMQGLITIFPLKISTMAFISVFPRLK